MLGVHDNQQVTIREEDGKVFVRFSLLSCISSTHTKLGQLVSKLGSQHLFSQIHIQPKTYQTRPHICRGSIFGRNLVLCVISLLISTHHMAAGEGRAGHTAPILETSDWRTTEWWGGRCSEDLLPTSRFYITSTTHDHCAVGHFSRRDP